LPDPPPPSEALHADDQGPSPWDPFNSRVEFGFAHYHFVEVQSSAGRINTALDIWEAIVLQYGGSAPWRNAQDLYETIDMIQHGDAPWKVYNIRYKGPRPAGIPPNWMTETFELCTRDSRVVLHHQLASSEFKGSTNFVPYQQFDREGRRVWSNLMSGDWAWKQAVRF
jgi:Plavaka transposase